MAGPDASGTDGSAGDAEYVFRVELQLSPAGGDLRVEPASTEVTLYKSAAAPGEEGWLFFRDELWRGEVNDYDHLRRLAEERLDVEVRSIEFRELRTDEAYYAALKDEIVADLELFRADDVAEVVNKYLGSRVHVRERDS